MRTLTLPNITVEYDDNRGARFTPVESCAHTTELTIPETRKLLVWLKHEVERSDNHKRFCGQLNLQLP
jgi:hypothetical protein